jgi:hypothetical protein
MSNTNLTLFRRGLLVATVFGLFLGIGAGGDDRTPSKKSSTAVPKAERERYLLLTDGRLIRGVITREDSTYTLTQKVGVIHFPARLVERSFDSVQEAYQYRLERIPEDDPAERLSLARWCLKHHLDEEAKAQLQKVVEISPDHGPARAMLSKLAQSEATRATGDQMKVDDAVRQTAGEEVVEDRAGALDSDVLRMAGRRMGISGLPVIFDLPPALAVRRAEDFTRYVHPILQAYCANCHNAEYHGGFQLVTVRNPRQRTPDAIRANLDATLRLIDPENPAKSDLLSSTLRPHGFGTKQRPIFSGSNNRAYQILAAWANSLRPGPGSETMTAASARTASESAESFAADRSRSGSPALEQLSQGARSGDPRPFPTAARPPVQSVGSPSYRYTPGQGMLPEDPRQGDPREFPVPYMLGGPRPSLAGVGTPKGGSHPDAATTKGSAEPGSNSPAGRPVPGASQSDPANPGSSDPSRPTTAKKKPVKIDEALLKKLLQNNANRVPNQ